MISNLFLWKSICVQSNTRRAYHAGTKQIIGIGCQMWGEWIPQVEDMYRMIYPYWAAHAETGWTDNKRKNYNRFVRSMDYFLTRWIDKNYINSHNIGIKQHQ